MDTKTDNPAQLFSKKIIARRKARLLAIQAVYSLEFHDDLDKMLLDMLDVSKDTGPQYVENKKYFTSLVKKVIELLPEIDAKISSNLDSNWRIERLPKVVKSILRVAFADSEMEIKHDKAMLINEYLELAKLLNHYDEIGFINKLLDKAM